ncbi:unnamed protein product [Prunus armeniaca]
MFQAFLRITVTCAVGVGVVALGVDTTSGYIPPWSSMEKVGGKIGQVGGNSNTLGYTIIR